MPIVAVAGLPGSGKSHLMDAHEAKGYSRFDDFNVDWGGNMRKMKDHLRHDRHVIVSDIEFCREDMRQTFEHDLGAQVQWIFLENNPFQCAKNVLYRHFVERRSRPWGEEIAKIERLSKTYHPTGDVRPVAIAGTLP